MCPDIGSTTSKRLEKGPSDLLCGTRDTCETVLNFSYLLSSFSPAIQSDKNLTLEGCFEDEGSNFQGPSVSHMIITVKIVV